VTDVGGSATPPLPGLGPTTAAPTAGYGTAGGWAQPAYPGTRLTEADARALPAVRLAAMLGIVSTVVGIVAALALNALNLLAWQTTTTYSTGMGSTTTTLGPTLSSSTVGLFVAYAAVALAFELAEIMLVRSAFATLAEVDDSFSSVARLTWFALIGAVVAAVGGALLAGAVFHAIQCVGSGRPLTQGCLFTGGFWAGIALLIVGGILALVGYIGILLGIWRLGGRYDNSLFLIAAILLIFPYVAFVGDLLILIGVHQTLGRVRAGATRA
jgi:hypothetical protein